MAINQPRNPGLVQQYNEEEEPSEGTKIRRKVEFVGRRNKNVKSSKSELGRDGAIKTRIIDEADLNNIMRDAIREKQAKRKKKDVEAKTGETTPIDTHPVIKRAPLDRQVF